MSDKSLLSLMMLVFVGLASVGSSGFLTTTGEHNANKKIVSYARPSKDLPPPEPEPDPGPFPGEDPPIVYPPPNTR